MLKILTRDGCVVCLCSSFLHFCLRNSIHCHFRTVSFTFSHLYMYTLEELECNLKMQVHPYTFRNEDSFLHLDFHQDPYREYDYWLNKIGVDGLFTDFTGSLRLYQQWTSPPSKDKGDDEAKASKLLHKIKSLLFS